MDDLNLDYNHGNRAAKSLVVFVGIQLLNLGGLVGDYLLLQTGNRTITETTVEYPILGIGICFIQSVAPISLGMHFYYNYMRD